VIQALAHHPAGQAGIREGDVVRSANGVPLQSQQEFVDWLRGERPETIEFLIERDGHRQVITMRPGVPPHREAPDFDIHYGAVETVDGVLRRTIITQPHGDGPFPAVVMLGGIGCYTLDVTGPHAYNQLLEDLTRAGYLTYWVEKSRMGDSQGTPCMEIDFETELSGYRAGLAQVRAMPAVEQERIILLGHSMGGIIGPILGAEAAEAGEPLHAVVAIATAGLPWYEYLIGNTRRQLHLSGTPPAQVEAIMREAVRAHYAYTIEKRSPAEIIEEYPDRAGSFQLPHHYTYFQQVADYSPLDLWARAEVPALLIAGGADVATSTAEHAYVVEQLNALRPGSARFILFEDMNHGLRYASDMQAAWDAARRGEAGAFHEELAPAILNWFDHVAGEGPAVEPPAATQGGAREDASAVSAGRSLRFLANEPREYDFGDQRVLPPTFGEGEFTFEFWVKPDTSFPVGSTARMSRGQLTNWSTSDDEPYSSPGWWYGGNWLLDGHTRPHGFDSYDTREGTFSLQLYGGGRLRWTFADSGENMPRGMVWAVQAFPASTTPSLLDGNWHHVACVRRWVGEAEAQLELWVNGELIDTTLIPQRVNMRQFWDELPHPENPRHLGGWAWGSEVMVAWNYVFTQYEDYKGLLDELRFWDRAKTPEELTTTWNHAVTGREPGLVGWFPFEEGQGSIVRDRLDAERTIELHRTQRESWATEGAPVGHVRNRADTDAIRQAALDYIEGWYAGDAERMGRSLHPELVKRIVRDRYRGSELEQMGAPELIAMTGRGGGRTTSAEAQRMDVTILDVFGNAASVRVDADAWIDYMQLARYNGEWKIVNVLWELRP
jgi:pimeloyl-ACP methyl ester carboxylesterase